MAASIAALPSWLPGVWRRAWIERRAARTDAFDVHYFQTPSTFADIRIPRDRPSFAHAKSFEDLTDAELLALAKQRGFSGNTTVSVALATWHHEIDFQPPDTSADIGRLERVDDSHMFEHATDSSYVESWRKADSGESRFLVVRVERARRLDRTLIVVGDRFIYVRNRTRDLPPAESIDSLIVSTHASRAQIIAYLDCEFSVGRIHGASIPWQIERSTLPWRESRRLDFANEIVVDADSVAPRKPSRKRWSTLMNSFSRAELLAIIPAR
ncbi:MAG: hypothetical protein ABI446_11730 [Gemmatimonadaceae bacterium]